MLTGAGHAHDAVGHPSSSQVKMDPQALRSSHMPNTETSASA